MRTPNTLDANAPGVCPIAWTGADLAPQPLFRVTTADGRRLEVSPDAAREMLTWSTSTPARLPQVGAWLAAMDEESGPTGPRG